MTAEFKGTVIRATHRPEDLIPAFIETLRELCKETGEYEFNTDLGKTWVGKIINFVGPIIERNLDENWHDVHGTSYWESDYPLDDVWELFDLINERAPEGYYFGAHRGDGSDFGFWEIEDEGY